jgi:FSR family fosmidomycin resistance protein-like MFS transporter
LSFLFWNEPVIAITLAGTGNALFHVSGGILVLSLKRRKATYAGFFVAPGGIGLAVGSYLAISHVNMADDIIPILLVIMSIILYFVYNPDYRYKEATNTKVSYAFLPIVLILLPIAVRSLIGLSIAFPWKSNPDLYLYLILSIALGKIFGGILADKFGLLKTGLAGLIISAPLLAFYSAQPVLGILGAFIFNFTMPVTLVLVLNIIPQHRGFSFGLTTAALFIGAIPAIIKTNGWIRDSFTLIITILLAALLLIAAWNLEKYFKKANNQDGLRNTIFRKLITYHNN